MTKDEYIKAKADIVAKNGQPEWENREPMNYCAKLLARLKSDYANDQRARARGIDPQPIQAMEARAQEAQEAQEPQVERDGGELAAQALGVMGREQRDIGGALDGYVKDSELEGFTAQERQIIVCYLANIRQKPKEIAQKLGIKHHATVAAVLDSAAFQFLFNRLAKRNLKPDAFMGIKSALKRGDPRVSVEVLKEHGILGDEEGDAQAIKIQDPKAEALLAALGNQLVADDCALRGTEGLKN